MGESVDDRVEILKGLQGGEDIIGSGAILLKPMLVRALQGEAGNEEKIGIGEK
ncbi:hypothetical protein [Methyloglobulus morosus]|uniref:hypothetical protein n=1 Tax=Methyloglobulus morosus TaxID=1410681 RepID=UPI001F20FEE8|nr:hypothetical protein [Methyloglobulus morosus]